MNETELNKLHHALLYIADEIKRICDENNIKFMLAGGSVLGAVRHKGFIPWDDDMDISMLREDYDRFTQLCKTQLKDEFEIQTIENDKNYCYGFAKIYLKGTAAIAFGHEGEPWQRGIYVDVFPYDDVPDNGLRLLMQKYKNYFFIKLLAAKTQSPWKNTSFIKSLFFLVLKFLSFFCSRDKLGDSLVRNMKKYYGQGGPDITLMASPYGYEGERFNRSIVDNIITVPFEDRSFPIFDEYDTYLSRLYGDYMQLPPPEKRHTHDFVVLDFGKYDF